MKNRNLFNNKKRVIFWLAAIVLASSIALAITLTYPLPYARQIEVNQNNSNSALDIASTGIDRVIKSFGEDYPIVTNSDEWVTKYKDHKSRGGTYTTSYKKDPDKAGNILIISKGSLGNDQGTIRVSVRQMPSIFNYTLVANGDVSFERKNESSAYGLINGDVHTNGNIDISGKRVFINNPNFKGEKGWQTNLYYDPEYSISAVGKIMPATTVYSGEHASTSKDQRIEFPAFDFAFYKDQSNFKDMEVKIYSSNKKSWSVSEINDHFAPADPYSGSIIVFESGDIRITGSGTITSTILVGPSVDSSGDIEIIADKNSFINLIPQSGPALVASIIRLSGDINIGTHDSGAIVAATKQFEIEALSSTSTNKKYASHVVMHGTLVLGDATSENSVFDLSGRGLADFVFKLNYTSTVLDKLPNAWQVLGTTVIHEDYRIEE